MVADWVSWVPGTVLTVATAAALVGMALPEPDDSFERAAFEAPFSVPKRADPIPVHPALVHPGWCQPATALICQEI
jgi:hypothetical protein